MVVSSRKLEIGHFFSSKVRTLISDGFIEKKRSLIPEYPSIDQIWFTFFHANMIDKIWYFFIKFSKFLNKNVKTILAVA
jgi:hypothetical protein